MLAVVKNHRKNISIYAILIFAILLISWPSLLNDFSALDDADQIIQNSDIRSLELSHLHQIFTSLYIGMYQPLATLSFAIEYHFFGINPLVTHAFNIIWHLLNSCLAFYLFYRLTGRRKMALLISLLFAIHPVQVETVAWASARSNLIMTCFYLGALISYLWYLQKPKVLRYFGVILLFLLALLAKAPALTLPLTLLAIDYYFGRLNWKALAEKTFLFALSGVFMAITWTGKVNAYSFDPDQYNWLSRLTFIPYSLISYCQKILAPINLQIFYPYPQSWHGYLSPSTYLSWLLLAIIFYGLWAIRHRKLAMFGILFFASTIITQLPWIPANQAITADRYLYLSSIGLFFIIIDVFAYLQSKNWLRKSLLILALTVYLLTLGLFSFLRHLDWFDSAQILEEAALSAPWSGLIYFHTSNAYLMQQDYAKALAFANHSIMLDPDNAYAYNLSASILVMHFQDYIPAINRFNQAIKKFPTCAICYYGRAYTLVQLDNLPSALADLQLADKNNDKDQSLAYKIKQAKAEIHMKLNQKEAACLNLAEALKLQPNAELDELTNYCQNLQN